MSSHYHIPRCTNAVSRELVSLDARVLVIWVLLLIDPHKSNSAIITQLLHGEDCQGRGYSFTPPFNGSCIIGINLIQDTATSPMGRFIFGVSVGILNASATKIWE